MIAGGTRLGAISDGATNQPRRGVRLSRWPLYAIALAIGVLAVASVVGRSDQQAGQQSVVADLADGGLVEATASCEGVAVQVTDHTAAANTSARIGVDATNGDTGSTVGVHFDGDGSTAVTFDAIPPGPVVVALYERTRDTTRLTLTVPNCK